MNNSSFNNKTISDPLSTNQPPEFLTPAGKIRYQNMATELMNDLTTIKQKQRTRKNRITTVTCTLLLTLSSTWVWSALSRRNNHTRIAITKDSNRLDSTNTPNPKSQPQNKPTNQTNSYYTTISKTKSTLVKTYTTEAVNEAPAIVVKPITDQELIELFRKSGKQIGLSETQGKTTITGDAQITRLQSNHPDEQTPSSNALPNLQNSRSTTIS